MNSPVPVIVARRRRRLRRPPRALAQRNWWRTGGEFDELQWRVHVNGIRGKSTVTRIIAGMMREAGLVTMAKSTGHVRGRHQL